MVFFFFFQAEDGIRDDLVTGVQTCALPICGQYVRFGALEKVTTGRMVPRSKVDEAVRHAAAFLRAHRIDLVTPMTSEKRHGPAPRRTYAELALLALHRAGTPASDPLMVEL